MSTTHVKSYLHVNPFNVRSVNKVERTKAHHKVLVMTLTSKYKEEHQNSSKRNFKNSITMYVCLSLDKQKDHSTKKILFHMVNKDKKEIIRL